MGLRQHLNQNKVRGFGVRRNLTTHSTGLAIARLIGKTPVWVFHGDADLLVPITEARQMVAALKAAGGNVKYTEYPGIGHGHAGPLPAQTSEVQKARTEPDFIAWLFAQRLAT